MKRFVEGTDRGQSPLFPECPEDWIDENNPVQGIDVFVDELDLGELGFDGVAPEVTGRPSSLGPADDWPKKWREFNIAVTENSCIVTYYKDEVIDRFAALNDISIGEVFGLLPTYRHIANFSSLRS